MVQLLYIIASLHVLLCPFTKVEESFNIQATHDILYHRHNLSQYDHNEFPGVVPRSFIGPLVISVLSAPVVTVFHLSGINKFWMQYVVRLTLALTVIAAWSRVRNALQKQYGNTYAWWYTLITVTQYHFMFYMSRPLPNIIVLPLVLMAFEAWLSGKPKQFIIWAGSSIIIFRSELAMLFGLLLIIDLYFKKIDFKMLFKIVIPSGVGLLALTVAVDSLFWGRLLWPEGEVFWYNTVLNKSVNWGTSPFLWYFYSALPRGLGPSLVLIPVGLYLDKRMIQFAAPAFVYILLYSFLPHKELRFIIYVFPLLNMASAAACSYIYLRRTKAPIYEILFWGSIFIIIGNILISLAFTLVAMTNYPGGVAITRFHKLMKNEPFVHVHICNLAAQTGVTRFSQTHDSWGYSKNESLPAEKLQEYTHLIIEAKSKYSPSLKSFTNTHVILDSIESFSQVSMNYKLVPPVRIKTKPALFILERKDFHEYPKGRDFYESNVEQIYDTTETHIINEASELSDDSVINVIDYEAYKDVNSVTQSEEFIDIEKENKEVDIATNDSNNEVSEGNELPPENKIEEVQEDEIEEVQVIQKPPLTKESEEKPNDNKAFVSDQKLQKAKKAMDELKSLRQERKKKAIEKIKLETRKEVVASAKEKLKEIMNRHKHLAAELTDVIVNYVPQDTENKDARGDIPDIELGPEQENGTTDDEIENKGEDNSETVIDNVLDIPQASLTNENVDSIVEEVIVRLIDRKIYDDKTKPEDIKPEDRLMIQKIVEEVLAEKMNYMDVEKQ